MNEIAWRLDWRTVALACVLMTIEGYDLVIYGSLLPFMLKDPSLGMQTASAGLAGSAIFGGMLIGGVLVGALTRWLGLRRVLVIGIAGFSLSMLGCALTGQVAVFTVLRFIAGIGLGVVMPGCMSMARASCTTRTSALAISIVMMGIPSGGILASLVAYLTAAHLGWRPLFIVGAIIGLAALPFAAIIAGQIRQSYQAVKSVGTKFLPKIVWRPLVFGALATFCFLLSFYGLATWLTKLMTELNIGLQGALQLTLLLNIGAVVGSVLVGLAATKFGSLKLTIMCGVVCAVCLALVPSGYVSGFVLLATVTVLGMASPTTQNLVNALVSDAVPAEYRTTVLGMTLGIGRMGAVAAPLIGSALLLNVPPGHGLASPAGAVFLAFGLSCLVGVGAAIGLGTTRRPEAVVAEDAALAEQPVPEGSLR